MRDPRGKDPEAPLDMVEPGDMDQTRVAMCKYIRKGNCKSGSKCKFSHPQEAPTPDGDRMFFVSDKKEIRETGRSDKSGHSGKKENKGGGKQQVRKPPKQMDEKKQTEESVEREEPDENTLKAKAKVVEMHEVVDRRNAKERKVTTINWTELILKASLPLPVGGRPPIEPRPSNWGPPAHLRPPAWSPPPHTRGVTRKETHGSWLSTRTIRKETVAHGSWLMAHGSWLMAHGSWLMAHGSWLMAQRLRLFEKNSGERMLQRQLSKV
jgi:hypothetical protein